MKMRIVAYIVISVLISATSIMIYSAFGKPKTGYILVSDVFSRFEMKKEVQKKFDESKKERQRILDTLAIQLRILANEIDNEKMANKKKIEFYNLKREEFLSKKSMFQEDEKQQSVKYDNQILVQLNKYVSDFGKKNNYQYIFGNDGNGSLMYAYEEDNITEQVISFINKKYEGAE
jgi:outer membrane protein